MYAHIGRLAICISLRWVYVYVEKRESGPKKDFRINGFTKTVTIPTSTLNRSYVQRHMAYFASIRAVTFSRRRDPLFPCQRPAGQDVSAGSCRSECFKHIFLTPTPFCSIRACVSIANKSEATPSHHHRTR